MRRQLIQKILKTPESIKKRQKKLGISTKKKVIDRKSKLRKRIKYENNSADEDESIQKPAPNACDTSPKTDVKQENDGDERLEIPENFSEFIQFQNNKLHINFMTGLINWLLSIFFGIE